VTSLDHSGRAILSAPELAMLSSPPRILHVTNRFGGGLATCMTQYANATPELFHFLLCNDDVWAIRDLSTSAFDKVTRWESGAIAAMRQLRKYVVEESIDVVHAHSSVAGALARLARLPARVVYTPNAYAMLAPRTTRQWWGGQTERLLGMKRITIAGVGAAERGLAQRLSPRSEVVPLVNTPHPGLRPCAKFSLPLRVVMVGRLNAQKAPMFFAGVAAAARAKQLPIEFTWLGDGEQAYKDALHAAGVEVTGWLDMQEVHRRQGEANVYLHSGLYEGFSLSILDAAAQGLPSIGRPLPGIAEVPWMMHGANVEEAVACLEKLTDQQTWVAAQWAALTEVQAYNDEVQRDQLYRAYGLDAQGRFGDLPQWDSTTVPDQRVMQHDLPPTA
jgi:glycosyltransferase involved in cell wall biosynthesis